MLSVRYKNEKHFGILGPDTDNGHCAQRSFLAKFGGVIHSGRAGVETDTMNSDFYIDLWILSIITRYWE